jgi:triphosphoribosyl-dephospho-CoA synthase
MDINEKTGLAAEIACLLEVSAEKPGNVTPRHNFSDTKYEDFLVSATAIGRAFRHVSDSTVGETILQALKDTRALTGANTNLGIILLLAPLAKAFTYSDKNCLRDNLRHVLKNLTIEDAKLAYEAIRLAGAGGMDKIDKNDVNDNEVTITLLEAMEQAKDRDSIAREYVTGYEITIEIGLPALKGTLKEEISIPDVIVQTYLTILSQVPDTLIVRENGMDLAKDVSLRAKKVLESGGVFNEKGRDGIRKLDIFLRRGENSFALDNRLNPGTTADLTASILFVYLMENNLKIPR